MDLPLFSYFLILFLVIGNSVIRATSSREQIITNVQDGRLNLNDSLSIEDLRLSHGLLNLHNALSTLDLDLDDALEDVNIIKAVANSINEWKLRKYAKNNVTSANGMNKKRIKRDEEAVCYRNYGCFRDEGAFDYLDTLPVPPETINTTFSLFTRELKTGELLDYSNLTTLTNSKMSNDRPVKIIIHGFGSSGRRPWVVQMTDALIYMLHYNSRSEDKNTFYTREDVNVIVVDWEAGAALPNYVQAAANTQLVGRQIAHLIKTINQHLNFEAKDYHLIGFSLGAHVAGFAGAEVKNISRITGLDPASPLFESYGTRVRLDPSDAKFVDVIHSNGDSFLKGGLGSFQPMGHLDFYPNGGRVQVGCNSVLMGALTDIFYGKWQSLCHHRRAFRFFIDSLVPSCRFHAFACDSYEKFLKGECFTCGESGRRCAAMGYYASSSKGRGKFYLMTRNKANQYKIRILSSNTQQSTWGKLEISFISKDANETFPLTSESDEIKDKAILQGLVVAHPIIRNITHVLLKYTKYRGWIYSGKDFWAVDKIILQNSDGEVFSYCGFNTVVQNNESVLLDLERKNCTLYEASTDLPTARVARLFWKVVSPIRPPNFLWRLTDYTPINKFNYQINSNNLASQTAIASQLANFNNFNLQTGLYNLNPNQINTANQKQSYAAYSSMTSMNPNLNSMNNLKILKANQYARHHTTPAAMTTAAHPDTLNNMNIFKLNNNNDRMNGQSIGQIQNELDFNEMQTTAQKVQQINLNTMPPNMNVNLNANINSNTNAAVNLNTNLEETDRLFNGTHISGPQIIQLNQLNNTFAPLANKTL